MVQHMSMIKVKFCGLTRHEDIEIANRLKPDYIGFVFYKKSKRFVDKYKAKGLKKELDLDIKAVGVFVDEDIELITELVNENIIDIIQLHGKEDEEYIKRLKSLTDAKIIKAFQIKERIKTEFYPDKKDAQYEKAFQNSSSDIDDELNKKLDEINKSSADMVLIDSGQGTGTAFDWKILNRITRPYFLAGGVNTENIKEAADIRPYAIDVSSGIETDSVKDEGKMKIIIEACKER